MNILQMDMNLLKVLYLLTCTGSSQKTADKLGISTSAVSHALARLREVLDEPLFRREGHRQVPTLFALSRHCWRRKALSSTRISAAKTLSDAHGAMNCWKAVSIW
jgi:DNA-binding transcriptional LysR family regulator